MCWQASSPSSSPRAGRGGAAGRSPGRPWLVPGRGAGRVLMRSNDVLDDDDIAQGHVLGCQPVPDPDGEGEELHIRF